MQIIRPTESETLVDLTDPIDADTSYAVVETDEHEQIVLQGMSQAEVDAKLEDFLTWAS